MCAHETRSPCPPYKAEGEDGNAAEVLAIIQLEDCSIQFAAHLLEFSA